LYLAPTHQLVNRLLVDNLQAITVAHLVTLSSFQIKTVTTRYMNVQTLVIDELSMVDMHQFTQVSSTPVFHSLRRRAPAFAS
jgi:DNA replication protein DnaC